MPVLTHPCSSRNQVETHPYFVVVLVPKVPLKQKHVTSTFRDAPSFDAQFVGKVARASNTRVNTGMKERKPFWQNTIPTLQIYTLKHHSESHKVPLFEMQVQRAG